MKTSNPYGPGMPVKTPPETITSQTSKADGKAKARYPSGTFSKGQKSSSAGSGGKRAYTPGGPAGS
jgi:hypothetical protein